MTSLSSGSGTPFSELGSALSMFVFPLIAYALSGSALTAAAVEAAYPMTYVVDAARALFAGTYPADVVAQGVAGAAVVAALGFFVGVRAMRRSS